MNKVVYKTMAVCTVDGGSAFATHNSILYICIDAIVAGAATKVIPAMLAGSISIMTLGALR